MGNLAGKVAVVTGSTRGIGKAIAVAFAKRGAAVVISGRSTDEAPNRGGLPGTLQSVEAEVRNHGGDVLSVAADLSRTEGVEKLIAATTARFGRCDVLVNNAALSFLGTFLEVPARRWTPVIAVNLLAPVYLIEAFLPGMIERDDGRIINFSSGAADTRRREPSGPGVQQLPYSATKSAIEALSYGLAYQVAGSGVSVNCVRPSVATEAVTFHAPHLLDDPSGRWAHPDDYGEAMAWLAEQPSEYSGNLLTNDDLKALGILAGSPV
jgi:NAD(P)-dependent dehydrogenase (short-subunit alcohol dehydrogenase family)